MHDFNKARDFDRQEELDEELLSWIKTAYTFADAK